MVSGAVFYGFSVCVHVRLTSVCASCDFFPLYLQIVYLLHPILVCFYSILLLLFLDICFYSKEGKKEMVLI